MENDPPGELPMRMRPYLAMVLSGMSARPMRKAMAGMKQYWHTIPAQGARGRRR